VLEGALRGFSGAIAEALPHVARDLGAGLVELLAPLRLMRLALPGMRARRSGAVVNVASDWALTGARGYCAYATSKAALAALTREMAHDFGPLGVRVNAIAPGEVETAMLSPGTDKIVEKLPMQRLGQPKEVADVIWFLCSDQSSYISGAEIEVNGAQHV
jgi:NAD(P)-dependent dehydrogenase (short-subunit alcohol dehydrogenase family)